MPTVTAALLLALRSQDPGALALSAMAAIYLCITTSTARRAQQLVRDGVRLRLMESRRANEAQANRQRADDVAQRLADQHRLLTQLMQTSQQGFWFIDNDARTTDLNPAMARMLSEPHEAVMGRRVQDFVAPEDQALLEMELAQRIGGAAGHYELTLLRTGGHRLHCVCSATALFDAQGAKVGSVGVWTDITQRRSTEAALRHYELAVNAISDVVSVVDRSERYLLVNDAWCRASRVPREAALGRLTSEVLSHRVTEARLQALRECMATGEMRSARSPDPRASRPNCVIETHYFPQKDDTGRVQQVVMVTRDVTDQERSRNALLASAAEHRALLDNFPGYISRLDRHHRYTYVNHRLAALFGRTPEAVVGGSVAEVLGVERATALQPMIDRVLAGEAVSYEHTVQPPGAEPVDLQVRMVAGADPLSGEPVVYGFTLDITQRKRAEAALRASSAELGALLAAFPGYIAATDEALRYTYVNDRLLAVWGVTREAAVGRTVREVLGDERAESVEAAIQRAHRGEHSVTEASFDPGPDGQRLVLEVTRVTGTRQADGRQTCYAFGVDITARKRAEEALIAARDEAENANRAKSQFLSQMSHELRTPLNAILGFGQLLDSDPRATLVPHQQAWVREMLRGADHLLSLINEILDLGRIEAGELPLELQALAPGELVDECLALVQALAQSLHVTLGTTPGGLEGLQVCADRRRLKQVLLNLLGNAIKYNRPGGEVAVLWRLEGGELWLGVRDSGRGLTPEEQERLFQPFERLGAAQSGIEGTGIGLAISRRLVLAMGGQIGVHSVPGEGSTFWLRLPRDGGSPSAPGLPLSGAPLDAAPAAPPAQPEQTVLYIEDNPVNVALMEAMLARLPGVRLLCAETPSEGLRLAAEHQPALVLLDIHLPEMDGFAVLRHLHQMPALAHTPVLAVSANALQEDIAAAHEAGFAAYLTKPLALDTLLDTVRAHLGRG